MTSGQRYQRKNISKGLCRYHPLEKRVANRTMCQKCLDKMKARDNALKQKVMEHYGARCTCSGCGVVDPGLLTIDHINNDGKEHRKMIGGSGVNTYRWLVNNGFPEGFRTLCYNCNCGRAKNGGTCPCEGRSHHKETAG